MVYRIQGKMLRPTPNLRDMSRAKRDIELSVRTMSNGERALRGWWLRRQMIRMSRVRDQILYRAIKVQDTMGTVMKSSLRPPGSVT